MKNKLNPKIREKIVIVTNTFYNLDSKNDIARSELAKKTIKKATDLGYSIVVIDGGSSEKFIQDIKQTGVILECHPQTSKDFGWIRRKGINTAFLLDKKILVWMEPEKSEFVDEIEKISEFLLNNNADIVIPKRVSCESYPIFQQYTEKVGNLFWKKLTGFDLDIWFGPRIFKREIAKYFLEYNGEFGDRWECFFTPLISIAHDKKDIKSFEIKYDYPPEQTEIEEDNLEFYKKRLDQLTAITDSLYKQWGKFTLK